MTQKIITITREYGSGGRLIAKKVAEALNIAFYDNELIDETARQLGIDIDTIRKASQEKSSSFAYSLNLSAASSHAFWKASPASVTFFSSASVPSKSLFSF